MGSRITALLLLLLLIPWATPTFANSKTSCSLELEAIEDGRILGSEEAEVRGEHLRAVPPSEERTESSLLLPGESPPGGPRDPARSSTPSIPAAPVQIHSFTPQLRAKGYEYKKTLGEGGEGVTVLAEKDGKLYAIKVAGDGRNKEALRVEAALLDQARVKKTGDKEEASPFFSKGELIELEGGRLALVQDFFPHEKGSNEPAKSLHEIDKADMPEATRLRILTQLLSAFEWMHERGVIHRDFKPGNVLVDKDGNIRVVDFGMSAKVGELNPTNNDGMIMGTPQYLSPSQWAGGKGHPTDDLHAWRKVAWELLTDGRDGSDHSKPWDHQFLRYMKNKDKNKADPYYIDYSHAPEAFTDPRIAIAVWSRLPKTAKKQKELLIAALRSMSKKDPKAFYDEYGKLLASETEVVVSTKWGWFPPKKYTLYTNYKAAEEILASKELIARFPDGLGLNREQQDTIIRGFFALEKATEKSRKNPETVRQLEINPDLYFTLFRQRLRALQKDKKADSDWSYRWGLDPPS